MILYTFRPSGTITLMSDIFSLSYNTVRNSQKKDFIVHFGSTSGAIGVQKTIQMKTVQNIVKVKTRLWMISVYTFTTQCIIRQRRHIRTYTFHE